METGNRNSHVHKHDLGQYAKIKDNIWNVKTTKVKVYTTVNTWEGWGGADGGLPLPCQTIFLTLLL